MSAAPDAATDIANGITLCRQHHDATRGREHQFAAEFAALIGAPLVAPPAPNRKDRTPLDINADDLRLEYIVRMRSTVMIAGDYGVTPECVQNRLRVLGIPARTRREVAALRYQRGVAR